MGEPYRLPMRNSSDFARREPLRFDNRSHDVKEIQATDDGNTLTETVKAQLVAPWPNATKSQFLTVRVRLLSTGP
jgi:hypothetical protein